MTHGRDLLLCPECGEWVPHTRGYLNEHNKTVQRGALVTGSTFCDGSSTKPRANLKSVEFTGMCTNCVSTVRKKYSETYPGSLEYYGGIIVVQCEECGPEGNYCANCDHLLHKTTAEDPGDPALVAAVEAMVEDLRSNGPNAQVTQVDYEQKLAELFASQNGSIETWVDTDNDPNCPDGQPHAAVHREAQDRPVTLTDNHIITVPPGDDDSTEA